jgi:hypothetical protein
MEPEGPCPCSASLSLDTVLNHKTLVHTLAPCFFKIHHNFILSCVVFANQYVCVCARYVYIYTDMYSL